MVAVTSLFLLATTVISSALITRDSTHATGYELIRSDLEALDHSVQFLTAAIDSYSSGTAEAAPVFAGVSYVN